MTTFSQTERITFEGLLDTDTYDDCYCIILKPTTMPYGIYATIFGDDTTLKGKDLVVERIKTLVVDWNLPKLKESTDENGYPTWEVTDKILPLPKHDPTVLDTLPNLINERIATSILAEWSEGQSKLFLARKNNWRSTPLSSAISNQPFQDGSMSSNGL